MTHKRTDPAPLALKPDLAEADRRWKAFYAGELIDRPVACVTAPCDPAAPVDVVTYRDRVFGDLDEIVDRTIAAAEAIVWAGEAIPAVGLSFGPDEIGVFAGAGLGWTDDSDVTNWSIPFVDDWASAPPLALQEDHPLWRRMLELYRRTADRAAGKMVLGSLDLHTNMDLLSAVRGPQRLCTDLLDCPDQIDRRMDEARAMFRPVWDAIAEAGRMDELGYCHCVYSMAGAATLQCDFCCMIGPEMFRRWVLPALQEEAEIVGHAVYHWDGPDAVVHLDDLLTIDGVHALGYVPGTGYGGHIDHLDLLHRVQAGGKAVQVSGTIDQIKFMHRVLRPDMVIYQTSAASADEAEQFLDWLVKNT